MIFLCFICNISLCNTYVILHTFTHTMLWLDGISESSISSWQTRIEMVSSLCWTLAVVQIQIFPRPFQKVFDYSVTSQDSLISYEQTELISMECITSCVLLSMVNLTCLVPQKKIHWNYAASRRGSRWICFFSIS